MERATAGQKLIVLAHTAATGVAKTGDAANLTAYVSIDGGPVTAIADTSATELSATNAKGYYAFDLALDETNGSVLVFTAKSATAGVEVNAIPAVVQTSPGNFSVAQIAAIGGHFSANVKQVSDDGEAAIVLRQMTYGVMAGVVVSATSTSVTLQGFTSAAGHYPAGTLIVIRADDINEELMFSFVTSYLGNGVFNVSPAWPITPVADMLATVIPAGGGSGEPRSVTVTQRNVSVRD